MNNEGRELKTRRTVKVYQRGLPKKKKKNNKKNKKKEEGKWKIFGLSSSNRKLLREAFIRQLKGKPK